MKQVQKLKQSGSAKLEHINRITSMLIKMDAKNVGRVEGYTEATLLSAKPDDSVSRVTAEWNYKRMIIDLLAKVDDEYILKRVYKLLEYLYISAVSSGGSGRE